MSIDYSTKLKSNYFSVKKCAARFLLKFGLEAILEARLDAF
jgi:hypothetical protein